MFGIGGLEIVLAMVLFYGAAIVAAYFIIKLAVRNGTYEAHRRLEAEDVRRPGRDG